jgi:2-alkenal reductase
MNHNTTETRPRRRNALALVAAASLFAIFCGSITLPEAPGLPPQPTAPREPVSLQATQQAIPTFTPAAPAGGGEATPSVESLAESQPELVELYEQVSPGVVNIQVFVNDLQGGGAGAGSGFVIDGDGHVVTNNHVVADAQTVIVAFPDGSQVSADVVGLDPNSDLAVVRLERLPEGAHPLPLGDSAAVAVGEWVVAIGNPFGLGTSMSIGIVSATGRAIASGATPFSIPEAIQTDAAINPGNSGGPLINLNGEVIGVNAQIATTSESNSGVGFAIPVNVVRRVAPALIANGSYRWPWLGIEGEDVHLLIAEANGLPERRGAYIHNIVPGGPAEEAGLQGSTSSRAIDGIEVPVGGDVVMAADGQPVNTFTDLLTVISSRQPGDQLALTVLREGGQQDITVTLAPRPDNFGNPDQFIP